MKNLSLLFLLCYITNSFGVEYDLASYSALSNQSQIYSDETISVMTLNTAHGRQDAFHQVFLNKDSIQENLDTIVETVHREKPHVVALQEADGPSFWSGRFNHVQYIADQTHLENYFHDYHVDGFGLHYGTALLSGNKIYSSIPHTFESRSFISLSKGFVLSSVMLSEDSKFKIDIVSMHLDFLLDSVRQKQLDQIVDLIKERNNPVIIMGDLNADSESDAFNFLISTLKLKPYDLERDDLSTFPKLNKRIDWILISNQMEFVSYKVLPDILSDHRAVVAEIRITR
jgi:endonuclease/exonuclease/phosphatase family metal-dependent hydrolase